MPEHKVTTFPPEDDPGWYEADVWDCLECGVKKIDAKCSTCVSCEAPRPEDSIYRGRCWGLRIESDPTIKLTDLPIRSFITGV